MPWGQKTKTKNRSNVVANSIKALKWSTSTLKKKKEEELIIDHPLCVRDSRNVCEYLA